MRFKQFLENYEWEMHENIPKFHQVDLATRDIMLSGEPVTLKFYLEYRRGDEFPSYAGIELNGPSTNPDGSVGLFFNLPGEEEELEPGFKDPSKDQIEQAFDKIIRDLERVRPSEVFSQFSTSASGELRKIVHGNLISNMFDGDDDDAEELKSRIKESYDYDDGEYGDKVEDDFIQLGKLLVYLRLSKLHKPSSAQNPERNILVIGAQIVHKRVVPEPFEPEYAFSTAERLIVIQEMPSAAYLKKMFATVRADLEREYNKERSFRDYDSTDFMGMALDAAAISAFDRLENIQMLGDMFDGDDDSELNDRLRKLK
jgi:hypothetical protein